MAILTENVEPKDDVMKPKQRKREETIPAGEPSYPTKKLRADHRASNKPSTGGKSMAAIKRLLAGSVLNAEVDVRALYLSNNSYAL